MKLNLKKLNAKVRKMFIYFRNKKMFGRNEYVLVICFFLYFKDKIEIIFLWGVNIDCCVFL